MTDVDTSSYLKPGAGKTALEQATGYAALQNTANTGQIQQQVIKQNNLDQANQALSYMTRAMGSLGPNASKDDYAKAAQNAVDMGLVPQQQENIFLEHLKNAPDSLTFYKHFMASAMDATKQIEFHTGVNATATDQQNVYQGKIDPLTGGFTAASKLPIQLAPAQEYYGSDNQKRMVTPQEAPGPVPMRRPALPVAMPPAAAQNAPAMTPAPANNPVPATAASWIDHGPAAFPTTGPTGPTIRRTDLEAGGKGDLKAAPDPLFDEGKKAYTDDLNLTTQKLTNLKPALLALDLIPGLRTGPGTETWNKAVAGLKSNNIIPTETKNDPTAIYQEVDKYLNQYLKGRGDRSDADLEQAAKSSPNPGIQINPALLKLTQTAAAQDRIEAARALNFKGNDYQNYGKHKASFPAGMDERAFIIDKMTPDQRKDLAKDVSKMNPTQKKRFINSLKVFDETNVGGQ